MSYRIQTVSKVTRIPVDTIRNWEKRYKILRPRTGKSGEKLYSDNDVAILRKITSLLRYGGRISEIAAKVLESNFLDQDNAAEIKVSNEVHLMIEEYFRALLAADLRKIDQYEDLIEISETFQNRTEYI